MQFVKQQMIIDAYEYRDLPYYPFLAPDEP